MSSKKYSLHKPDIRGTGKMRGMTRVSRVRVGIRVKVSVTCPVLLIVPTQTVVKVLNANLTIAIFCTNVDQRGSCVAAMSWFLLSMPVIRSVQLTAV